MEISRVIAAIGVIAAMMSGPVAYAVESAPTSAADQSLQDSSAPISRPPPDAGGTATADADDCD